MLKRYAILITLFFFSFMTVSSQVTIFSEDFEVASNSANVSGSRGSWTVNNFGTLAFYPYNTFAIQASASCGYGDIGGTQYLQVTGINSSGNATCAYQNINATNNPGFVIYAYKQVDGSTVTNMKLSYKWKCNGQSAADYGNLIYTTDLTGATGWTVLGSDLQNGTTATTVVTDYALPTSLNNSKFLLGWKFTANASTVAAPGLILDDILVTGTAPAAPLQLGAIVANQQTDYVARYSTSKILRLDLPITGTIGTLTLNSLKVTAQNTSASDITNVKLWTGSVSDVTTQIGTTQTFASNTATFSGLTQGLVYGTNYLWITYDIASTATLGNTTDAKIVAGDIVISAAGGANAAGSQPSTALDPAGNLTIDFCKFGIGSDIEPITQVTFAGINNATSATLNGTPAYERFVSTIGNVTAGQGYNMIVKGNTGGNYSDSVKAFIDWNNDGIFSEATEAYKVGLLTNSTGADAVQVTTDIVVPVTAVTGNVRMRIAKTYGTAYLSPCNLVGFGQAEDYTLTVTGGTTPVSLTSFKGERQGANNLLSWTTATEINNTGFELQRSTDGTNFSQLAFVASKASNGNSNANLTYAFTDTKSLIAGSYYRLKQIDRDGKSTLSQVVFIKGVKVSKLELVSIYPNPAIDKLNIALVSPKADNVTFVVSDLSGKVIIKQTASVSNGDNNINVNVSNLAKGTYTIKAICADGCETAISKFVKQ